MKNDTTHSIVSWWMLRSLLFVCAYIDEILIANRNEVDHKQHLYKFSKVYSIFFLLKCGQEYIWYTKTSVFTIGNLSKCNYKITLKSLRVTEDYQDESTAIITVSYQNIPPSFYF